MPRDGVLRMGFVSSTVHAVIHELIIININGYNSIEQGGNLARLRPLLADLAKILYHWGKGQGEECTHWHVN